MSMGLDYLAARLHGRRSRLAEAERLDALAQLRTLSDLERICLAPPGNHTTTEFQHLLIRNWVSELTAFLPHLSGPEAGLIAWLPTRFDNRPKPFFAEAAMDRDYFRELLHRAQAIRGEDGHRIRTLFTLEVDAFHMMLAIRGRFHYHLAAEALMPMHVEETRIPHKRFSAMLSAPDIASAAALARGRAWEGTPGTGDPSALETMIGNGYLHLANRIFRRSHTGFGVVVGYLGIRRVEIANLTTISEGLRIGITGDSILHRLIPRTLGEALHA